MENVKGLVGHDKGRTLDTIVRTLNDIGYTVDFNVLNSKFFGVPQNRERIFIIALRDDLVTPEPWIIEGTTVVPKSKQRIAEYEGVKTFNFDWPTNDTVTTRLRDVLEAQVDEKYYLSENKTAELVAQLEAKNPDERMSRQAVDTFNASELPKEHGDIIHAFRREHLKDGICPTLSTRPEGFKTAPLPIVSAEPQMLGHVDISGHDAIKRVNSTESVSPTLTKMGGGHREPKIAVEYSRKDGVGREREVAPCLSSGDWRGLNRNQKQNPVLEVRPVLTPDREEKRQNGRRFKDDGEESFTLTTQDRHGVAIGKYPIYRIRKLTPRECWRLQGFPDEVFDRARSAGVSDSQLYKQAGNAVTVNVIEAIGERLIPLMSRWDEEVKESLTSNCNEE